MSIIETDAAAPKRRDEGRWLRLRTLVLLRWWAIAGQFSALIVVKTMYEIEIDYGLCFLVIGVAVISNFAAIFLYPSTKRLSEGETFCIVLFDLLQLGFMLYLTGGLNNPFSILIVGPVTVSASALNWRSTLALGATAIVIVTVLIEFHLPLRTGERFILQVADIFRFGSWVAIVISTVFLGVYARWIVSEMRTMSDAVQATQMALAREQKLTDLGGVVAAAAHELGTPLATIKLASSELADDIEDPELRQDALLIREQADRCRDILREMGRAGKSDPHMRSAPLMAVLEEAAEPHANRGKEVHIDFRAVTETVPFARQPTIYRRPEIIHGLRNVIQNAVDFASTSVWINAQWDDNEIRVRIMDDGPGYPSHRLDKIGEPFIRSRPRSDLARPEYEGMGLGLFIAKTLLERSGAVLTFANGWDDPETETDKAHPIGAVVAVVWQRSELEFTS